MSIAQSNHIKTLEERIAALEAAFSRPRPAETHTLAALEERVQKLSDKVQGIVMRMGKKD